MQSNYNQWPQNYQEILDSFDPDLLTFNEPFDAPDFTPIPTADALIPKASCDGPKGSIGKPIKRRSRASKKAPITLLKADANNFRALVQQFTGYHSPAPGFGSYRGPINLNFQQCAYFPKNTDAEKQKKLIDHNHNHNLHSCNSSINISAANEIDVDDDRNRRAEALTYDGYDVEEIWGQEMLEVLPGTIEDGFWGY